MVVDDGGKAAVTLWRRIGAREGQSLVEFNPETGRTHQIRVHAARGLGAPILGDPVYGQPLEEQPMLLHAWRLVVPRDPRDAIDVTAPVPDSFGLWLDLLDEA
jgi:tRNA pseudouridine32 synthase/23S rRNA pseudouridine746 synthase